MKLYSSLIILISFLLLGLGVSVEGSPQESEMKSRIEAAIREKKVNAFVRDIIKTGRIDAVKLCFEANHAMAVAVVIFASELPDGEFRDRIALMALKSAAPQAWPEDRLLPYGSEEGFGEAPLFTALIKKYCPEEKIYLGYLKSKMKRNAIALDIQRLMALASQKQGRDVSSGRVHGEDTVVSENASQAVDSMQPKLREPSSAIVNSETISDESASLTARHYWAWISIAIMVVGAGVYIILRNYRR